jgi:hypothetical protein
LISSKFVCGDRLEAAQVERFRPDRPDDHKGCARIRLTSLSELIEKPSLSHVVVMTHNMMNNVSHYVVMRAMPHVVVNVMVVTLFGDGGTNKQRHRHGKSGNNFLLHLRSPGRLPTSGKRECVW